MYKSRGEGPDGSISDPLHHHNGRRILMGKMNNAVLNYLSDKRRFADLINAELYGEIPYGTA